MEGFARGPLFITRNITIITVIIVIIFILSSRSAGALTMSNSDYNLQMGNFDTPQDVPESEPKVDVLGEKDANLFLGENYTVYSSFHYTKPDAKFRFSISETFIDFGVIDPGTPVTRTNSLTVYAGSALGYSVYASQNAPLTSAESGTIIPNTTCDDGNCTENSSSEWSGVLTYGFGYRCDNEEGKDCPPSFTTSKFYKHFADSSKNEIEQEIMSGTNVGKNKKVKITYKLNISATQKAGPYGNIVTYVATPTF